MMTYLVQIALAIICIFPSLLAIDNPHFYRSTFFWGEPRFDKEFLSSLEIKWGGATTSHGYNSHGKKCSLFDIYGFTNIHAIADGVSSLNPANPIDALLLELAQLPQNENFGHLSVKGSFQLLEAVFNAYQNIINGFFMQAYLPLRHLRVSSITYTDFSPQTGFPNKNNSTWQSVLQQFPQLLEQYGLNAQPRKTAGIGDFSLLIGWACNYEKTERLDFIDVDSKIGLLFPTGKANNENNPFTFPLGYNGHYGVPLHFNCALGAWEWLTVGIHLGALFFFDKHLPQRLKTSPEQSGIFMLAQESVLVDQGTIWDIDCYIKADHVLRGFSLLFGYSFDQKDRDSLSLNQSSSSYNLAVVNSDERLRGWQMHTLHLMAEYDFAHYNADYLPRLGFFYDIILAGKRIFSTSMKSLYCGIDLAWCY